MAKKVNTNQFNSQKDLESIKSSSYNSYNTLKEIRSITKDISIKDNSSYNVLRSIDKNLDNIVKNINRPSGNIVTSKSSPISGSNALISLAVKRNALLTDIRDILKEGKTVTSDLDKTVKENTKKQEEATKKAEQAQKELQETFTKSLGTLLKGITSIATSAESNINNLVAKRNDTMYRYGLAGEQGRLMADRINRLEYEYKLAPWQRYTVPEQRQRRRDFGLQAVNQANLSTWETVNSATDLLDRWNDIMPSIALSASDGFKDLYRNVQGADKVVEGMMSSIRQMSVDLNVAPNEIFNIAQTYTKYARIISNSNAGVEQQLEAIAKSSARMKDKDIQSGLDFAEQLKMMPFQSYHKQVQNPFFKAITGVLGQDALSLFNDTSITPSERSEKINNMFIDHVMKNMDKHGRINQGTLALFESLGISDKQIMDWAGAGKGQPVRDAQNNSPSGHVDDYNFDLAIRQSVYLEEALKQWTNVRPSDDFSNWWKLWSTTPQNVALYDMAEMLTKSKTPIGTVTNIGSQALDLLGLGGALSIPTLAKAIFGGGGRGASAITGAIVPSVATSQFGSMLPGSFSAGAKGVASTGGKVGIGAVGKGLGKVAPWLSALMLGYDAYEGYNNYGDWQGSVAQMAGSNREGGWAGALEGALKGAGIGALGGSAFAGIGAVPGAIGGAVIGGIGGAVGSDTIYGLLGGEISNRNKTVSKESLKLSEAIFSNSENNNRNVKSINELIENNRRKQEEVEKEFANLSTQVDKNTREGVIALERGKTQFGFMTDNLKTVEAELLAERDKIQKEQLKSAEEIMAGNKAIAGIMGDDIIPALNKVVMSLDERGRVTSTVSKQGLDKALKRLGSTFDSDENISRVPVDARERLIARKHAELIDEGYSTEQIAKGNMVETELLSDLRDKSSSYYRDAYNIAKNQETTLRRQGKSIDSNRPLFNVGKGSQAVDKDGRELWYNNQIGGIPIVNKEFYNLALDLPQGMTVSDIENNYRVLPVQGSNDQFIIAPKTGEIAPKGSYKYTTGGIFSSKNRINDLNRPRMNREGDVVSYEVYRPTPHATGLSNVPYDNYPALLHKDERVLSASETKLYNDSMASIPNFFKTTVSWQKDTTEFLEEKLFKLNQKFYDKFYAYYGWLEKLQARSASITQIASVKFNTKDKTIQVFGYNNSGNPVSHDQSNDTTVINFGNDPNSPSPVDQSQNNSVKKTTGTDNTPKFSGSGESTVFEDWYNNYGVTSRYGQRWGRLHAGVDFGLPSGTPLGAIGDGVIDTAGWYGAYGNVVDVKSGGKWFRYAHLSRLGAKVGDRVKKGQVIGYSGATGGDYGDHLHFEVRSNPDGGGEGNTVDPLSFFGKGGGDAIPTTAEHAFDLDSFQIKSIQSIDTNVSIITNILRQMLSNQTPTPIWQDKQEQANNAEATQNTILSTL
jgi:Membrane proteins related to metalloendopeptidases